MKSNKWKLEYVSVEDIIPAPLNANKMSEESFNKLTQNIKKSGLSTAITCVKLSENGKYQIIGGHHRYEACVRNGYTKIPCIYANEENLSKDEIIAIQLSHNSLHGEDDKGILKRLFEQIASIDFKEFAHIDTEEIGTIDTFSASIVPISEHYSISIILYKEDLDTLDELIGNVKEDMQKNELIILANQDNNEEMLLKLIKEIGRKYHIKSSNVCFSKILQLAKKALEYENLDSNN
ncbi:ParB/RepB/Spo0J family partition protein [Capnocytophaga catalasegens]|uniref:ParB-like N-terminal domain-containing protein n=1 Tax=Capnocytophaga catalasegens TaxID=1004260 RepID=A0AAV5ARC5_9FLAO|nr:ParB/RepB/Spo0J family partition protein [Capnocytophaga catalasegens]GIZ15514.1 hypothetical protein RCZ03_15140 [Capnocytophaga catalasegens]GJM49857.1 hypothetical protein RCZ15_08320 [Capnocytophaga catalasegens]GJM54029.1 hypothetical protein RCZ16_23450 [Capnocytophaga catalasegens]